MLMCSCNGLAGTLQRVVLGRNTCWFCLPAEMVALKGGPEGDPDGEHLAAEWVACACLPMSMPACLPG